LSLRAFMELNVPIPVEPGQQRNREIGCQPPVDWHAFEEAVEIGYWHARERLEMAGRACLARPERERSVTPQ
jgi:hypothetical protein